MSMHAKYQVSISYGSKSIAKVKVDDRLTRTRHIVKGTITGAPLLAFCALVTEA